MLLTIRFSAPSSRALGLAVAGMAACVRLSHSGKARQKPGGATVARAFAPVPAFIARTRAKRIIPGCLPALFVALALPAAAQIAAWDFTGENTQATSAAEVFDERLDASNNITRGSAAAASEANHSFRTLGFKNNGIATSNLDYFQVTLSAAMGYSLFLGTIDAKFFGTDTFHATPGVSGQFAYSLDGTAFELIGSPFVMTATGAMQQIDLFGISALQNVPDATTVTLRFYASGQTTSGGWGFYSDTAGEFGLAIGGMLATSVLPALVLTAAPTTIVENAVVPAAIGTVAIPAELGADLIVSLASDDLTEASVPASVTVKAGSTSVNFEIAAVDDLLADGAQTVILTASAAGYTSALQAITVNDDGDAPPALGPGAIAFVGYNADGDDDLAFVALVPIAAAATIFFTDNEWNGLAIGTGGAFNTGEGVITWTAPVGGVAAGTVVTLDKLSSAAPGTNVGAVAKTAGTLDLNASEETVYAYQGAPLVATGFLAVIATHTTDSITGTGLSPAHLVYLTENVDIAAYTGSRGDQPTFADYLAAIGSPGKWLTGDGPGSQHNDSIAPDVPFDASAFTLATATGYAAWAKDHANNDVADGDADGDGVLNGVEYFMGEPGATFTRNPAVVNGKISWPHNAGASASYAVKTSSDLIHWATATSGVKDSDTFIEFTLPDVTPPIFVRLEVVTSP